MSEWMIEKGPRMPCDSHRTVWLGFCIFAAYALLTAFPAYAGTSSGLAAILCDVYDIVHDDVGRGLATLAVISLGVGAMFGKISWGLAVTVGVGIGILFGANTLSYLITRIQVC